MEWIPVIFVAFKAIVLFTGMFFAVKWHYDQGKKHKDRAQETRAVLRGGAKAFAAFVLALLVVGLLTYELVKVLGM